jgi:hypothetical protein
MILWTNSRPSLRSTLARTAFVATLMFGVAAGQGATTGAFVVTLGSDTTAVEQYTRSGNTITGDLVVRLGGTVVNHYRLTLNSDGTPAILVVTPRRA